MISQTTNNFLAGDSWFWSFYCSVYVLFKHNLYACSSIMLPWSDIAVSYASVRHRYDLKIHWRFNCNLRQNFDMAFLLTKHSHSQRRLRNWFEERIYILSRIFNEFKINYRLHLAVSILKIQYIVHWMYVYY